MKKYYQGKRLTQNKSEMKKKKFIKWVEFLALKKAFFDEKDAQCPQMSDNVPKCPNKHSPIFN
jgi:hypothetical protein